jgi:hypothetical protein
MADNNVNGGPQEDRLERIEFLFSVLFDEGERISSEIRAILAAQIELGQQIEQLREQALEDRGKLDGQIGFADLFRDEVGQWLNDIDRKLSELSNG